MRKIFLIGLIVLSIFLIACETQKVIKVVCNKPYILVGTSCCLDQNNNSICDKDETIKPTGEDATIIKEKDEIREKPKQQPKKENLIGDVDRIKEEANKIIYQGLNNFWRSKQDPSTEDVVYHLGSRRRIVIAEIKNEKKFMDTYSNFSDFPLNFEFIGDEEGLFENKSIAPNTLENISWVKTHSSVQDWSLTSGKIKEYLSYKQNKKTKAWKVHHSFNIYCAPNLYIRLFPDWYQWGQGIVDVELSLSNMKVDALTGRQKIIPKASELLERCLLKKEFEGSDTIYRLQDELRNHFGIYYAFLKLEDKNIKHQTFKGGEIVTRRDDTQPNIVRYVKVDYNNLTIVQLKNNDITTIEEFKEYVKGEFSRKKSNFSKSIIDFEESLTTSNFEKKYANLGEKQYFQFHNFTKSQEMLIDDLTILKENSPFIIETLYSLLNNYAVNYKRTGRQNSSAIADTKKKQKLIYFHKARILCKPNIVIVIQSKPIETYQMNKEYSEEDIKDKINEAKTDLVLEAKKIAEICSSI